MTIKKAFEVTMSSQRSTLLKKFKNVNFSRCKNSTIYQINTFIAMIHFAFSKVILTKARWKSIALGLPF